jgi:hypothetical protein
VKILLPVAAATALLSGNLVVSAAHQHPAGSVSIRTLMSARAHSGGRFGFYAPERPKQTGGTPTASTPVATATAPAGPTATPNPYPDPVTIFQNAVQKFAALQSTGFEEVTDGEQTGVEKLHIDAKGVATCKGPSLSAHATGTDTLTGTSQSRKANAYFIVIKNKAWVKSSATKNVWAKTKVGKVAVFSFTVDNPLDCPQASSGSGSGSGSGSSGSQELKGLVNLGPDTFNGVSVWHLQGTGVVTNPDGSSFEEQLDFYISQKDFLLYKFQVKVSDPAHGVTLVQSQILSNLGKKVTIKAPKVGSKKP